MLRIFQVSLSKDADFNVLAETREDVTKALKNTHIDDWVDFCDWDISVSASGVNPLQGAVDAAILEERGTLCLIDIETFNHVTPTWKEDLYKAQCEAERKSRNLCLPGIV